MTAKPKWYDGGPLDAETYRRAAALCVEAALAIEAERYADAERAHAEVKRLLEGSR